jgi:hypothetical protein
MHETLVTSDSYKDEQQKQRKSWKLFSKRKSKSSSQQDEMNAWETAPSILPPPPGPAEPQPQQIRIQDNATTLRTLKQNSAVSTNSSSLPPKQKQQIYSQQKPIDDNTASTKITSKHASTVLARPFGREGLLLRDCMVSRTACMCLVGMVYTVSTLSVFYSQWIVQVSAAEWANNTWKYRITVQQRQGNNLQDFTNGFTLRSLADFAWFEQAIYLEFHGGLLLPSLSISLGIPDLEASQHEVDSKTLACWLSDTLNGIRGQGELVLSQQKVNVIDSEAMEAFLYRSELVDIDDYSHMEHTPKSQQDQEDTSVWDWVQVPEICGGSSAYAPTEPTSSSGPKKMFQKDTVSSKALGDSRTFQLQNSFVETSPTFDLANSTVAQYLPLIQAERDLVWMWRTRALGTMELLRKLKEQEKSVGTAWKRFAITISNLFSYEKEVESARIGDSKRVKLQNPYRKLHKSAVDDCLRILANAKMERSIPGLDVLEIMLNAYIADLSTVHPSVEAYLEGLHTVSMISHEQKQKQEQEEKKSPDPQDVAVQKFLSNEAVLQRFLTTICQTAPLRTSRMAHKFFEQEWQQSQTIQKSAETMRSKINVASKESLAKVIHRHLTEEKEDRIAEVALVQRMVDIGNSKKFVPPDQNTQEVEKGVELSKDDENEEAEKAAKRDIALLLCRERIGRWDAKLAMAIMEAVGVSDANVRVEETTRELRLVRKYAIGLREHLQRCMEALEYLQFCVNGQDADMSNLRQNFMTELQTIFSTTYLPTDRNAQLPVEILQKHGIHLRDPSGWLQRSVGSCGGDLATYLNARESGSEWLMNSLGDLLKDYNQRVESVESFVYMECLGIQLEKHFSQTRATALAAFEKKTDITSAINIATRKRMPALVKDLQAKLETVGADVSHTTVKEAKEAHLDSKALKQELNELGMRRLTRSRETSTERVIALMTIWSKEEEDSSTAEIKALETLMLSLEQRVVENDLKVYMDASPTPA